MGKTFLCVCVVGACLLVSANAATTVNNFFNPWWGVFPYGGGVAQQQPAPQQPAQQQPAAAPQQGPTEFNSWLLFYYYRWTLAYNFMTGKATAQNTLPANFYPPSFDPYLTRESFDSFATHEWFRNYYCVLPEQFNMKPHPLCFKPPAPSSSPSPSPSPSASPDPEPGVALPGGSRDSVKIPKLNLQDVFGMQGASAQDQIIASLFSNADSQNDAAFRPPAPTMGFFGNSFNNNNNLNLWANAFEQQQQQQQQFVSKELHKALETAKAVPQGGIMDAAL